MPPPANGALISYKFHFMKKQHHQVVFEDIAMHWMQSHGIQINKSFIAKELQTHPDYPSLVSLTDFLDRGGMQYHAVEGDKGSIKAFSYPLLAHVNDGMRDYMMQANSPSDFESDEKLRLYWSGIVLFADGKPHWEVPENTKLLARQRGFTAVAVMGVLMVIAAVGAVFNFNMNFLQLAWGALALAGLTFALFAITAELGMQIGIVSEVCNSIGGKVGCKVVLKSKFAKVYGGITVADLALSYFLTQLAFFLAAAVYPALMSTLMVMAMPLLLVTGASVIIQQSKLKRWCAICLGIAGVLAVQSVLAFVYFNNVFAGLEPITIGYFLAAQALLCLAFQPVKSQLKDGMEHADQAQDLLRWKRDPLLFIAQWERMQQVNTVTLPNELQFGNPDAALELVVACNPFCGPCQYAHGVLDKIYDVYKDQLLIKVRFLSKEDRAPNITAAVTAILQCARGLKTGEEVAHMLSDWFKHMNIQKWAQRWRYDATLDVKDQLLAHRKWMNDGDIRSTPTFFLNGRKMPKSYVLADLMHLIPILAASEIALQPDLQPVTPQ